MMTYEQNIAFNKAVELFDSKYKKNDNSQENLNVLQTIFETLAEYVDDTGNISFRAFFATIIQEMQDTKVFDLSEDCQSAKIQIYKETFSWVLLNPDSIDSHDKFALYCNLTSLGVNYLLGKEVGENSNFAYLSFLSARNIQIKAGLDSEFLDSLLSKFYKDENGNYIYKGE